MYKPEHKEETHLDKGRPLLTTQKGPANYLSPYHQNLKLCI